LDWLSRRVEAPVTHESTGRVGTVIFLRESGLLRVGPALDLDVGSCRCWTKEEVEAGGLGTEGYRPHELSRSSRPERW